MNLNFVNTGDQTSIACTICRNRFTLPVTSEQIERWQAGAHIQDAMGHLSDADRELFITGYCGACWKRIFAKNNEDLLWCQDDTEAPF